MKIAFFLDISHGLGGAGNVLLEQAKLMNEFHDVLMVIPHSREGKINPEYECRCRKAHIRYKEIYYTTAYSVQDIDILTAWDAMRAIEAMAVEENVDFFHSVQLNIAVELVSRRLKIPHLMNTYSIRKEEFALACIDVFPRYHSADSNLFCRVWADGLRMTTCCIRPSAPLPYIKRKERRSDASLRILMLGGVSDTKNQMLAIRAVELCHKRNLNVCLTIAGADACDYADRCRHYIEENGLQDIIRMVGFKSDIVPLLEQHDCYLCTSTRESFPSSIVESMTYDLTIISTPVAGVPELLKGGVNAYVSKEYGTEDIADCIMRCLGAYQDGKIEEIHKRASVLWDEKFSPRSVAGQLNEYYGYICNDYYKNSRTHIENKVTEAEIRQIYERLSKTEVDEDILSKCCYYACLGNILGCGNAYIWGAGKYGSYAKIILTLLFPQIKITAYIDKKKSGEYLGIPVIPPDQIETAEIRYVFLGFVQERDTVIQYLEEKGLCYNKDIWILP